MECFSKYCRIRGTLKEKQAKRRKRDTAVNILGQKRGSSNSGPAGPATTALATFPTGGHKAASHIQGNMSKTNTNKELPPLEKLVSQV